MTPSIFLALVAARSLMARPTEAPRDRTLLLAHYMPWFQAKPYSQSWGWHWTMGVVDPDQLVQGKRRVASQFEPLIGTYDSADPAAIECEVELMKLAGIDGALIDWYGNLDKMDYGAVHRNTAKFIEVATRAHLKFAVVYEDRTVPNLIQEGAFTAQDAIPAGNRLMRWLDANWFSMPNYLRIDDRPLLLNFGPEYYKGEAWNGIFSGLSKRPYFLTLDSKQGPADGAFGWPQPRGGTDAGIRALDDYYSRSAHLNTEIPPVFPRFQDYYSQAKVSPSWGTIEDRNGETFRKTFIRAIQSGAKMVQLVTWNDWGEGTVIEPSIEFGYRDLELTQVMRRRYGDPGFPYTPRDLRLPVELYKLRKRSPNDPKKQQALAQISSLLLAGNVSAARSALQRSAP